MADGSALDARGKRNLVITPGAKLERDMTRANAAMSSLMSGRDLPEPEASDGRVVATFTSNFDAAIRLFWRNPETGERVLNWAEIK